MTTITRSENETERFGEEVSRSLRRGDVLALYGPLGSGKTAFTRGLCRGLGCEVDVHSPTFNIINFYPGEIEVAHVDLFRLDRFDDIGWEDLFDGDRIVAIEWAEKAAKVLPGKRIDIFFKIVELNVREIEKRSRNDFSD